MAARITNAQIDARMTSIEGALLTLTQALAQYATPSVVAITSARSHKGSKPNKGSRTTAPAGRKAAPVKAAITPAQAQAKAAEKAAATAAYVARKDALSPLNKALFAQGLTGDAWAGRYTNVPAMKAAIAAITPAQAKLALSYVGK